MAWTNVFDIGDCVVEVYDGSPEFGDLIPPADYPLHGITVDTTGGTVTIEGMWPGWHARVVPQFATAEASVRVSEMNATSDMGDTLIALNSVGVMLGGVIQSSIELLQDLDGYGPDPANLIAPGEWDSAYVALAAGA